MGNPKLPLSLESPAYCLFVEELDRHLMVARESLDANSSKIDTEAARKLGASFHTIRGSAGFFGLSDVADMSKVLEEAFFGVVEGKTVDLTECSQLLDKLIAETTNLPRPTVA